MTATAPSQAALRSVASRRVGHFETDLLVRLVVPDGESGESDRVDRERLPGGRGRRVIQAPRIGRIVADRPFAVERDEVASQARIGGDEPQETIHPGRAGVRLDLRLVGDGRSTEPDRDTGPIDRFRGRPVEREVAVVRSRPEPALVRFVPDLEPPVRDRLGTEAGIVHEHLEEGRTSVFQRIPGCGRMNWRRRHGRREEAEHDERRSRPRAVSASSAWKVVVKSIGPSALRPDVAAALRDKRFPLPGGERAKETHAVERARRGREIVQQPRESGPREPVDVVHADGPEVIAVEDASFWHLRCRADHDLAWIGLALGRALRSPESGNQPRQPQDEAA